MIIMRLNPPATSFLFDPFKANSLFSQRGWSVSLPLTRNHPDHQIFLQTIWIVSELSGHCDISFNWVVS